MLGKHIMSWLRFLSHVSLVISVAVDAVVLCHVYPAFRRTGNKAFVFIVIACALGIIDTVYDHTVTLRFLSDNDYIVARTFRRFMYFADMICWGIGMVLLVRPYLKNPAQPGAPPNAARRSRLALRQPVAGRHR
jgi:hypothetical protein